MVYDENFFGETESQRSLHELLLRADADSKKYEARRENVYVASKTATGVASGGGTTNLHIKNTSSDKTLAVASTEIVSDFTGIVRIYDRFSSAPSEGTGLSPDNLLMDENNTVSSTVADVSENVSFTEDGTPHTQTILTGGSIGNNRRGGMVASTNPLIEPGREIVVQMENTSSSSGAASIVVVYAELDAVFSRSN